MAITLVQEPEDVMIAYRRQPDGSVATFMSLSERVGNSDDTTSPPTITWTGFIPAHDIDRDEVVAVIGSQLPALVLQVAALEQQLQDAATAAEAAAAAHNQQLQDALITAAQSASDDKQAALDATAAAAEATLSAVRDQLNAALAELDAIHNPPVPHVIRQRFEMALDEMGLLDQWLELVGSAPRQTQLRADYPDYYANDAMLLQAFTLLAGADQAQAELDQVFALAATYA